MSKTFAVRDLRNDTAGVLAAAERDGEAFISNRGRVVAKVVPVREADVAPIDEFIAWLEGVAVADTGWADELAEDKAGYLDEVEPKPWD